MSLSTLRLARFMFGAALAAGLMLSPLLAPGVSAADGAIFVPGEPVVTGFAGVLPPDAPPPGSDPLDYTFIDLDGPSMAIQQLRPDGSPTGQVIESAGAFVATARDVGQVFGVAFDTAPEIVDAAAPNIYLAASSAFGLNIVVPDADGNPVRSKLGAPEATFMAGQWGSAGGAEGYPGSIWKVDGETGEISLFTTIAANSGAGLGAITFDPSSQQFFVADLDLGLIYRLAADGAIIDTFDHGLTGRPEHDLEPVEDDGIGMSITDPAFNSEDPSTWGITQPERKVTGLAMRGNRLFYTVLGGLQVWSVSINADGSFGTPRWELDATALPSVNAITGMLFDPLGRMILAQRGPQVGSYDYSVFAEPGTSSVARYQREFPDDPATPGTWVEIPDTYAVGFATNGANASGGIALSYNFDAETGGFDGACGAFLWATGDALRDNADLVPPLDGPAQVSGLQGNHRSLIRPQNDPPLLSMFTDYDGNTDDDQAGTAGHVGAVAIWQPCEGTPDAEIDTYVPPPVFAPEDYDPPEDFNLTLEKWSKPYFCTDAGANWLCKFTIRVENTGDVPYWGPVVIDDYLPANNPGATMHFWPSPPWSCGPTGPTAYQCATGPVLLYPGDGVVLHEVVKLPKGLVDYCQIANVAGLNWLFNHDDDPSDDFGVGVAGIKAPGCVPPGGSDLTLKKITFPNTCIDGGVEWRCSYAVVVQNAGPGNFSGPITVTDTLAVNAPATTAGPWACGQVGFVLTCNIIAPPVNAPPGWSSGFLVVAHVPKNVGPPLCDLDNKANISAPAAGSPMNLLAGNDADQATAHIPDPACLLPNPDTDLEIKKIGQGCSPFMYLGVNGYLCKWKMTLTNIGPDPYSGPITLVDTSIGATMDSLKLIAPAICTGPHNKVTCALPGPVVLSPGVPKNQIFHTFYANGPAVCSVTNTLEIALPSPGSAQNPAGNDSATTGQILPNPACFAPGMPKLNIQKTATGCASDPHGPNWLCDFDITVFNYGTGPQPGPIVVKDLNSKPTTFSGAACVPSGPSLYTCTRPAPLAALSSWTFQATTEVNPNSVTLADCNVLNTVAITNPLAADPGHFSQASQKVPQLFINVGPGPVAVYCDPPSLKLEKVSEKTVKAGNGYDVTFRIKATSTGPDPYHGTVELDEILPDGTSYVSSSWPCVPTTGNDMHCSSPPKDIPVGKYTTMAITIHIPTDVAVKAQCQVINTVNAAISAEVLHSDEGVQYTASAAAKLPASLCRAPEQCPVKQLKPDGGCCETGLLWNGKQCAPPRKDTPKDPPKCPADSHLTKNGNCVCDEGTRGDPGKCRPIQSTPICPKDSRLVSGECKCLPGTEGRPGRCADVEVAPTCPKDSRLVDGECECRRGTEGRPGRCRPIEVAPICPKDSQLVGGDCQCRQGTEGRPGRCQPIEVAPFCPKDSRLVDGECQCARGTEGRPGRCRPIVERPIIQLPETLQPVFCPADSYFDARRKSCVCNPPSTGKPGNCSDGGPTLQLNSRPTLKLN